MVAEESVKQICICLCSRVSPVFSFGCHLLHLASNSTNAVRRSFQGFLYKLSAPFVLAQVIAGDEDSGDNGAVTYRLEEESLWHGAFRVHPVSGIITMKAPESNGEKYTLTVSVCRFFFCKYECKFYWWKWTLTTKLLISANIF